MSLIVRLGIALGIEGLAAVLVATFASGPRYRSVVADPPERTPEQGGAPE
ncbi:MAG: hypothetical protein JOZ41_16730 [Chloroflexi bacterium]|nr:hypothetical protein [Chloroflexota bacterium]